MNNYFQTIFHSVTEWESVQSATHRFGGIEFTLGQVEIGHIHMNGMVDIPFTKKVAQQLIKDQRAEPHHILPDTGWISFYIRSATDITQALWLFRLSYLQKRLARNRNQPQIADAIRNELKDMEMSRDLRAVLSGQALSSAD